MKDAITLTESAAQHIKFQISKTPDAEHILGLKLGIKKTGCSGYAYVLDFVKSDNLKSTEGYHIFKSYDVNIYVDPISYDYIKGTEVDYIQQGIGKVMLYKNPNATAECGCGESFTVDENKKQV